MLAALLRGVQVAVWSVYTAWLRWRCGECNLTSLFPDTVPASSGGRAAVSGSLKLATPSGWIAVRITSHCRQLHKHLLQRALHRGSTLHTQLRRSSARQLRRSSHGHLAQCGAVLIPAGAAGAQQCPQRGFKSRRTRKAHGGGGAHTALQHRCLCDAAVGKGQQAARGRHGPRV